MKHLEINNVYIFDNVDNNEKDGVLTITVNNTTVANVNNTLSSLRNDLWRILICNTKHEVVNRYYGFSNIESVTEDGDAVKIVLRKMNKDEYEKFIFEMLFDFYMMSGNFGEVLDGFTNNIDRTIIDIIKSDIR